MQEKKTSSFCPVRKTTIMRGLSAILFYMLKIPEQDKLEFKDLKIGHFFFIFFLNCASVCKIFVLRIFDYSYVFNIIKTNMKQFIKFSNKRKFSLRIIPIVHNSTHLCLLLISVFTHIGTCKLYMHTYL